MKRIIFACLIVCVCLLSACSGGEEARARPTRTPRTSQQAAEPAREIPGRLLYVRDDQIWIHAGDEARPLPIEGVARDPAVSPDGSRVAFIRRAESYSDLYVMNVQTGEATRVTFNSSRLQERTEDYVHSVIWAAKPTWSPTGDELIFLSQTSPATRAGEVPAIYEHPLSLYRYETRLIGVQEPLNSDRLPIDHDGSDALSPAWSPDGRYMAYVEASRDEQPRKLMLYDFETEQARQYPGTPDGAYDPAWSPDGSKLAFAASQDGATDIWVIEGTTNGTPKRLTELGRSRAPAWSPDGSMLAFVNVGDDSTDIYTVAITAEEGRLEAGEPIRLTEGANVDATAGLSWGK